MPPVGADGVDAAPATCVAALFDHEEVGSESAAGAGGSFITDVLARIGFAAGLDGEDRRRALARSFFISADMAHAYHPNFPAAYEPDHKVMVNGGPVIKTNANQRYATGAETAARFMACAKPPACPASSTRIAATSVAAAPSAPSSPRAWAALRRCRFADVGHAQRARKRRCARPRLHDRRACRGLCRLTRDVRTRAGRPT
jgi:aspartyl aminopeptidase